MTTCYYADSTIGIVKFTNNAGTWVSNYTVAATTAGFTTKGALGITADWTQNPVVVYATTAESWATASSHWRTPAPLPFQRSSRRRLQIILTPPTFSAASNLSPAFRPKSPVNLRP